MNYKICYDSKTNSVATFVENLETSIPKIKITDDMIVNEKIILVTYTIGKGIVPKTTRNFIENNKDNIISISSCGAIKYGEMFANAANIISNDLNIPIWRKFHKKGNEVDKLVIENYLKNI